MRYPTLLFDGTIAVGVDRADATREPLLTFSKMYEAHEIGQALKEEDRIEPIMAMSFKSVKSIDVVIRGLEYLKDRKSNFENLFQYNGVCVEA